MVCVPMVYVEAHRWLGDMPVAVFADLDTGSPQLYYAHPDHLNRPLRMTDGSKDVVWDATYKPFGEVHLITGSASLNLRFPGQYFLLEHGLAYNWHRYYDPTIGRYTRPDPLGLVGGPSVYGYVRGNPLWYIDPLGLLTLVGGIGGSFVPILLQKSVMHWSFQCY